MRTVILFHQVLRSELSRPDRRSMITWMLKRRALVLLAALLLTACGGGGGGGGGDGGGGGTSNSVTFETRLTGVEVEDTRTNQVIGARDLPVDGATITRN